jgi:hypothetical protein
VSIVNASPKAPAFGGYPWRSCNLLEHQKQAKESNEITFKVKNIASMAEENKDAVKSVTAATTSLNELSDSLGAQVKKFQII